MNQGELLSWIDGFITAKRKEGLTPEDVEVIIQRMRLLTIQPETIPNLSDKWIDPFNNPVVPFLDRRDLTSGINSNSITQTWPGNTTITYKNNPSTKTILKD